MKNKKPIRKDLSELTWEEIEEIIKLREEKKACPSLLKKKFHTSKKVITDILTSQKEYLKDIYVAPERKKRSTIYNARGIYMIRNDLNGRVYIGQAKHIFQRWQGHFIYDKLKGACRELWEDVEKYSLAAFSWKILVEHPDLTQPQLDKLENTFIIYYKAIKEGYNKKFTNSFNPYPLDEIKNKTSDEILDYVFKTPINLI